jgi:molybdate transport system substrate-binding protein
MTATVHVNLLCAGAAQGLVKALEPAFTAETGAVLQARFGAVGAMRELLLQGEPCDLLVLTAAMLDALAADGLVDATTLTPLGRVRTGVAVRSGEPVPEVGTAAALKAALRGAQGLFFPDPQRATAGIHFAKVLRELGLHDDLQPVFRNDPNGATSMRELAASSGPGMLGCTQVTEILYTPGVQLAGLLPPEFELATVYTAAVCTRATQPHLAAQLLARMAGPDALALRRDGGFEF